MKQIKIAHLATDEKFIDAAIESFEREVPGSNDLYLYGSDSIVHVSSKFNKVSNFQRYSGLLAEDLNEYDIIVIHSLSSIWFRTIKRLAKDKVVIWLGWGFDYYDIVFRCHEDLLLPLTAALKKTHVYNNKNISYFSSVKKIVKNIVMPSKNDIIERINIFVPVLPSEYEIVKRSYNGGAFPQQAKWTYGNLEDNLIKGFSGKKVSGRSILVGNSASDTNNHLDVFLLLSKINIENRKIVTPLSYGDMAYRSAVVKCGENYFSENFFPLIEFMSIDDYIKTIMTCGFVVMNHIRQQGVGNIVIMLYLGAKLFMQENCPTFIFLKELGAVVFSVQELESSPAMLSHLLDDKSMAINRRVVEAVWSKGASINNTGLLLKKACEMNL
jgi:hypothetical protein